MVNRNKVVQKLLKLVLIFFPALILVLYLLCETHHELRIPQNELGEKVNFNIKDELLEDAVNDVFQVPLRLFSRELCFQNNNKIISNGQKINPDHLPSNRGGATDIYIDYLDGHSIKLLSTEIGEKDCQTINKERLIGATITANFTLLGLIPLSSGEGSIFVKLDTNDSHLYVHLTHLSQLLLFVFSLLGISGLVLFLYSVVRFICEE